MREAAPSIATSLSIFESDYYLLDKVTVDKIDESHVITVTPQKPNSRGCALSCCSRRISGLPVADGDKLIGIITESDSFRLLVREMNGKAEDAP